MTFKDRIKKQTCVHWEKSGTDSRGRPTYEDPVELECRWSGQVIAYVNVQGEEKMSNAIAFVDGVSVGDVLYLGELDDSGLDQDDPLKNSEAWRVERVDTIPNLKNSITWYKVYL